MADFGNIIFNGYKCFKNRIIMNDIKPINIIIGRNNIGKSSILDIIEMINNKEMLFKNPDVNVVVDKTITEDDIKKICVQGNYGGVFQKAYSENNRNLDNYEIGKKYIGQRLGFYIKSIADKRYDGKCSSSFNTSYYEEQSFFNKQYDFNEEQFYKKMSSSIIYNSKLIRRIYAERNVVPEIETSSMDTNGYGEGITSIINNYLNKSKYNEDLVKVKLLEKLNEIMSADAHFTEIVTQQIEDNGETKWEVFLREETKGRIALSQSGSGIKTIIMVLVYTILIPDINHKELEDYIFLFEELENNLHPSLQRRLLKYIEELSKYNTTIFLTTHSNTMIDSFQNQKNVQLYHVIKEEDGIKLNVLNELDRSVCLNDIGVKASDVLQSNGIIWVEGPSDRIYINKWIDLWSNGKYREGFEYTCVFYGGRLLSNVTFDNYNLDELINLMKVNRNSVVIIDSDRKNEYAKINSTKSRIKKELDNNDQICIITKGREIENYIPISMIREIYSSSKNYNFDRYSDIKDLLNKIKKEEGKRFEKDKKGFAKQIVEKMTLENMRESLDLDINMKKIIECIKKWNR